ncbi:MAG: 23S rRNA C2501 and tRNA U34 5'-hydroxylation protein RlhA/YrrN/YrrO [Methanophagales archaeon]|nr:U32 family peptidase [Methanophagales archaeon]MCU4139300.1 23S rRNA C2501 and tRNA U34 5'-hydroxylation protein RlhA/YrrN/YrrO [Methanophagales archaeon]
MNGKYVCILYANGMDAREMRLSIPHPGHFEALKEIVAVKESEGLSEVKEVFMGGSPDIMGSGRGVFHAPLISEIKEQTEFAHEHGLKMNIVMNSTCLSGNHLTHEGFKMFEWYFKQLNDAGVDAVTVAEPYLVELLRDFPMEVVVSCLAYVDSPHRAKFYEELGADVITADTNINKNFDLLRGIVEAVDCKVRVIVNEACLFKCPFRYAHYNVASHFSSLNKPKGTPIALDFYFDKCISFRLRDPSQLIKSAWIRPEDIRHYEEIGIHEFKLSGRTKTVAWILKCMRAYAKRSFKGNLLDILDCPQMLRYVFHIENEKLEGCIEQWKRCKKICDECGYCNKIAENIIIRKY